MTQEEKDLLLRDLCCRLPYGIKVKIVGTNNPPEKVLKVGLDLPNPYITTETWAMCYPLDVRPYLRPMDSMTEEEVTEFESITEELLEHGTSEEIWDTVIDWFNAHHFDHRHLIEKGLAIAVTTENNPYK